MLKYLADRPNFFFWEETNPRDVLPDDLMVLNKKMSDFFSFKNAVFCYFIVFGVKRPFFLMKPSYPFPVTIKNQITDSFI